MTHPFPEKLSQFRDSEYRKSLIQEIANNEKGFASWQPDQTLLDEKTAEKIAESFLSDTPVTAVSPYSAEQYIEDSGVRSNVKEKLLSEIEELYDEKPLNYAEYNKYIDEIVDRICEEVAEIIQDGDKSSVVDILQNERVELITVLGRPSKISLSDRYIQVDSHSGHALIEQSLCDVMAAIGYTIEEYVEAFPDCQNQDDVQALKRDLPVNPQKLISLDEFQTLVDNALSCSFAIVLYGIVEVKSLENIRTETPLLFSNYAIGTYNPGSGTFFDQIVKKPCVTDPAWAENTIGSQYQYAPASICALYKPPYYSYVQKTIPASTLLVSTPDMIAHAKELSGHDAQSPDFIHAFQTLLSSLAVTCSTTCLSSINKNGDEISITPLTESEFSPELQKWFDPIPKMYQSPSTGLGTTKTNHITISTTAAQTLASKILEAAEVKENN